MIRSYVGRKFVDDLAGTGVELLQLFGCAQRLNHGDVHKITRLFIDGKYRQRLYVTKANVRVSSQCLTLSMTAVSTG